MGDGMDDEFALSWYEQKHRFEMPRSNGAPPEYLILDFTVEQMFLHYDSNKPGGGSTSIPVTPEVLREIGDFISRRVADEDMESVVRTVEKLGVSGRGVRFEEVCAETELPRAKLAALLRRAIAKNLVDNPAFHIYRVTTVPPEPSGVTG
jgi:hypothetical protein